VNCLRQVSFQKVFFSIYTVCNRQVDKDGETKQRAERRNVIKISCVQISRAVRFAYLCVTGRRAEDISAVIISSGMASERSLYDREEPSVSVTGNPFKEFGKDLLQHAVGCCAVHGCGKDARFTAEGDVGFRERIRKPFMELGLRVGVRALLILYTRMFPLVL